MRKLPPGSLIMPVVSTAARPGVSSGLVAQAVPAGGARIHRRDKAEGRARRDQPLLFGALLELPHQAPGVLHDPPADECLVDGLPLLRVFEEVDDPGKAEWDLGVVEVLLALEADLELRPLDRVQLVVQPDEGTFPVGRLAAAEKVLLVDAVDDTVGRGLAPSTPEQRAEHVGDVHHLVALPGRHPARPANQAWGADAALG